MSAATAVPFHAIEAFLRKLARDVRPTCRHLELEELVQVGWLAAIEALPRFDPTRGSKLTTYLHAHAEGAMRVACRRARRDGPEQDIIDEAPAADDHLDELRQRRKRRHSLKAGMRQLDRIERRLVTDCFGRGRSLRETADRLGLDLGRARWKKERALKELRRVMCVAP